MTTHFRCLRCGTTHAMTNRHGDGYCASCDAKKEQVTMSAKIIKAELERYRYRPARMTILEELQKFIREKPETVEEPEKLSNKLFAPPDLLPFIKD